jgi:hypothetical protein
MNATTKNILFISYFAGVDANCPAEWADDRLRAMDAMGINSIVLTNYGSNQQNSESMRVYKTPSLSSDDFAHELALRRSWGSSRSVGEYTLRGVVLVVGYLLKALTRVITRGGSGGKWSWMVSATPVGIWLGITKPIDEIYCTGGPPSAYFVGLIVYWITGKPLKIEFQDPLVGAEINRSGYKQRAVRAVERLILRNAALGVYVTKKAAEDARTRNPDFATKIIHNYPAAWPLLPRERGEQPHTHRRPIQILHLGTLYGSRNLDKLFSALDSLYKKDVVQPGAVQITNLGSVYTHNAEEYKKRPDFNYLPERRRLDALEIAKHADFLLLIQHDDSRSEETIPYKLYDYLNLGIPIILLIKNQEIEELCHQYSELIADCGNEAEIASALESGLEQNEGWIDRSSSGIDASAGLTIQSQIANILSI